MTRCVPCAACFQDGKGYHQTLEQAEPTGKLLDQSPVNADQVDLEDTISQMEGEKGIRIDVWYAGRMNSTLRSTCSSCFGVEPNSIGRHLLILSPGLMAEPNSLGQNSNSARSCCSLPGVTCVAPNSFGQNKFNRMTFAE